MQRTIKTAARWGVAASLTLMTLGAQAGIDTVRDNIRQQYPAVDIEKISHLGVPGWYRVRSAGSRLWVNEEATHMLRGNLTDLSAAKMFTETGNIPSADDAQSGEMAPMLESAEQVRQALAERYDMTAVDGIRPSAAPGWYQGHTGSKIRYISANAEFVVTGELVDMKARENLTPPARREARAAILADARDDSFLTYDPEGEVRGTITVFADTTCPYCRVFHSRLMRLVHNQGVRVRYAMYPRKGPKSDGAMQLRRVWCAEDPQQAMPDAYFGREFEWGGCDDPLAHHVRLVRDLAVRATPTTFTEDGQVFQGARSVNTVLKRMGLERL